MHSGRVTKKSGMLFVVNNFRLCLRSVAALLVCAVSLPNCNLPFTERKATSIDAPVTTDGTRTDGNSLPSPVFENAKDTGLQGGDPTFGADQNEIWYVPFSTPYNLQQATRLNPGAAYTNLPPSAVVNSTLNDVDPAFTADGRVIAFASNRDTINKVYFARRTATAFGTPIESNVVLSESFVGFDMSKDGLKLYVIDGTNLLVYERAVIGDKFTLPPTAIALPTSAPGYPSVSSNEQEILFNQPSGGGRIFHARLSADGKSYQQPTELIVGEPCINQFADANFSTDENSILYTCDSNIHVAFRKL